MKKTESNEVSILASQALMFQIRSLRQWHGEEGLSQRDLAGLAGIHDRKLRYLESARLLPEAVRVLLAIAIALGTTVESLINPDIVEELRANIEARRAKKKEYFTKAATAAPPNDLPCQKV